MKIAKYHKKLAKVNLKLCQILNDVFENCQILLNLTKVASFCQIWSQ